MAMSTGRHKDYGTTSGDYGGNVDALDEICGPVSRKTTMYAVGGGAEKR
jgi:hypothetical protein